MEKCLILHEGKDKKPWKHYTKELISSAKFSTKIKVVRERFYTSNDI